MCVRPRRPTSRARRCALTVKCSMCTASAAPGSEVTLYAVDEGVLSLTGYKTPDPLAFFYRPRPLAVRTALTLPTLLDEDPDARDFVNKGYLIGGGGESGANPVRKKFLACAFWNAAIRTDENGRASARLRCAGWSYPVSRDRRGAHGDAPVWQRRGRIRSEQVADARTGTAPIRQCGRQARPARGSSQCSRTCPVQRKSACTWDDTATQPKRRSAFNSRRAILSRSISRWSSRRSAGRNGSGPHISSEPMDKRIFRIACRRMLKVGFPAPLLRELRVRHVPPGEMQLLERMDPQVLEGNGTIRVSITNSRAIELQETLRQLLHYPYGCVEQTTSSTLPWLGLRHIRRALPALQRSDAEIATAVQRGVDRLLSMQTSSGGLAYWPGESQPMLWGSAYGGMGLLLAKEQGARRAKGRVGSPPQLHQRTIARNGRYSTITTGSRRAASLFTPWPSRIVRSRPITSCFSSNAPASPRKIVHCSGSRSRRATGRRR